MYLFSECINLILSFDCIVLYCMHVCRCTDFTYLPASKWLPPFAAICLSLIAIVTCAYCIGAFEVDPTNSNSNRNTCKLN